MAQTPVQDNHESMNTSELSQMSSGGGPTSVSLTSEPQSTPIPISATIDLARLLVLAQRINNRYEKEFDLSFSAMLLAFLAGNDQISQWFRAFVRDSDVYIGELLKRRNLTSMAELDRIGKDPIGEQELGTTKRQTHSARDLFSVARKFNQNLSTNGLLDVRHLMAAYIYQPLSHDKDLVDLHFNRVAWSNGFLSKMSRLYPQELEQWKKFHRDAFPADPPLLDSGGPSHHIVRDIPTREDKLGYAAYAYALAKFIMHLKTEPPLTISIQASWGGGKTSLMRMIQQQLDPEAFKAIQEEARKPRGELRIKVVLDEIKRLMKGKQADLARPEDFKQESQILTVWFNAWKYESSNQVWAGLANAIIEQIAARLDVRERELFYLRLNLKRLDADKIRQRIQERIFQTWWYKVRVWSVGLGATLVAALATAISGLVAGNGLWQSVGWGSVVLSAIAEFVAAVRKRSEAEKEVEGEPATLSMSELLDVPEYEKELGFVHQVEADLKRVLASIPNQYKRILIFVDDLDRCYPDKVAQVMSAINLFLAGDFESCYFVLGMDTEMVAAALQVVHKDMVSCLPPDARIPLGWRFMDKFVQLPVLLPAPEEADLERYIASLFATQNGAALPVEVERRAGEAAERISNRREMPEEMTRFGKDQNAAEVAQSEELAPTLYDQHILDSGFATFDDNNPEIRKQVEAAARYLTHNPRDLKRFINCFRFFFSLWWLRKSKGLAAPSLDQLMRWLVLCLRWPEAVRWLRRGEGNTWLNIIENTKPSLVNRLKTLEDLSANCKDLLAWQQALSVLRLTPDNATWLEDDALLQFFSREAGLSENDRLSNGLGKGFW